MKLNTSAVLALGSTPALAQAWSLGPSYFPSDLLIASPSSMLQRQRALANRFFRETPGAYSPRYQLIDNEEKFQISVDVPGVKADDLDVSIEDGYLSIRGQRIAADDTSRFTSKFSQTFSLDPAVDAEKLSAALNDGVLVVSAPKDLKRIEENVRKIPILQSQGDEVTKLEEKPTEAQLNDDEEIDLDKDEGDNHANEIMEELTS